MRVRTRVQSSLIIIIDLALRKVHNVDVAYAVIPMPIPPDVIMLFNDKSSYLITLNYISALL